MWLEWGEAGDKPGQLTQKLRPFALAELKERMVISESWGRWSSGQRGCVSCGLGLSLVCSLGGEGVRVMVVFGEPSVIQTVLCLPQLLEGGPEGSPPKEPPKWSSLLPVAVCK